MCTCLVISDPARDIGHAVSISGASLSQVYDVHCCHNMSTDNYPFPEFLVFGMIR